MFCAIKGTPYIHTPYAVLYLKIDIDKEYLQTRKGAKLCRPPERERNRRKNKWVITETGVGILMGTGGADQRLASLPSSSSFFLGNNVGNNEKRRRPTRRTGRCPWAAAAGYCVAILVGLSGISQTTMSAMAARQRQHPVAAMARNLFHPSARERRQEKGVMCVCQQKVDGLGNG